MLLFRIAQGYAALGALTAAAFVLFGIGRAMPAARGAYAFRPLLLPGLVLLWPLVVWRWWRLTRSAQPGLPLGRHYRLTHRAVWTLLAIVLPVLLLLAVGLRQQAALDPAPVRLSAP